MLADYFKNKTVFLIEALLLIFFLLLIDKIFPPDFRNLSFFQHLSRVNGEFLGH